MQELEVPQGDVDFIQLDKELQQSETLTDKLEALYKHLYSEWPLFRKVVVKTKDNRYAYGEDIDNEYKAAVVGRFLLSKTNEIRYKNREKYFLQDLRACRTEIERKDFIEEKIRKIKSPVDHYNAVLNNGRHLHIDRSIGYYVDGYTSEKGKTSPRFPVWMDQPTFEQIQDGVLNRKLELYIKEMSEKPGELDTANLQRLIESKFPKLKWAGTGKQLYDVFRQLYSSKMVSNTKEELADFISEFVQFEKGNKPSKSTISSELKRDNKPMKGKRINISDKEE